MNIRSIFVLSTLALGACASSPQSQVATSGPDPDEAPAEVAAAAKAPVVIPSMPLSRGLHAHAMTEVVLDAGGQAALTLDDFGALRLWPDLHTETVALPVVLPEQESSWFSLAKAGDDAFVVGTVDTTGSARISRITIGERGVERVALFEIPATDPQFEIHVLDGGKRVLALGKDHRVRLFDDAGRVLSQIDQRSFIPWQLRVIEAPGQPVALAAVLTQPVRAQKLALEDDKLQIVGEPWMVALDQSPNRNDMALSPDGTTIAALRRHGPRNRGFALQLIELATGTRRVIVGELDTKARPRLHYAENGRVLLESGSGKGFWIDLAQAVPRDSATFPPAVMQAVALPGAGGDLRMQVTEVAGVRAIATGDVLTIDPVGTASHRRLVRTPLEGRALALDASGTRFAWSLGARVFVEDLASRPSLGDLGAPPAAPVGFDVGAAVHALAFDDAARLVVGATNGTTVRDATGSSIEQGPGPGAVLAAFDATAAEKEARKASVGLALRGRDPVAAVAAPASSLLAVAISASAMRLSDRHSTGRILGMFDSATKQRLWSAPLGHVGFVAFSGDGKRIAMHEAEGLVVRDAHTGDRVFARTDAGMVVETRGD